MKKRAFLTALAMTLLFALQAQAANLTWYENLDEAKAVAQKENKQIFVNFSGSDWCHWCIKLDKDILSQDAFKAYAKDNLVMLLVDFPKRKKLSKAQMEHNEQLANQFNVRGFPTVVLLKPNGKLISVTGYRYGGPEAYVEHIKQLITE